MSPVYVEVAKNIKSAVEQMRKVQNVSSQMIDFHEEMHKLLAGDRSLDSILKTIVRRIKNLTKSRRCSIVLGDEIIPSVLSLDTLRNVRILKGGECNGLTGWAIQQGRPFFINDAPSDPRYDLKIDGEKGIRTRSMICSPLKFKKRVIGCLRVINKIEGNFTEEDMRFVSAGADYTAFAIERAFLYEKLKNDELTNLFNIRYLNQALEMEIERARRYGVSFSVIFMDMDNFKEVNDKYGHLIGSRVLIEIAQLLQRNLRRIDIISRYGGDEFVIILPQTSRDAGFIVAERLRRLIEGHVFLEKDGYNLKLTASLGVASYPENAKDREGLLKLADRAMYRGKSLRKNKVFAAK